MRTPGFAAEVPGALERLEQTVEELAIKALLNGPFDNNGAMLTINARDGGIDANDWAEMLLRMYINWAEKNDYAVEVLDRQDNEEAGITSATIAIRGPFAYGYLKGESGIHRLVRISPFNAEGKRQTSFAAVDVAPEVGEQVAVEIRDEDLEEQAIRASGPGGQHVNKTSSAIRLDAHAQRDRGLLPGGAEPAQEPGHGPEDAPRRLARVEEEKREAEQAAKYNQMPKVGFGSQIRNYFLHPEQRVKDARTGYLVGSFHSVLDGNLQGFLDAFLRWKVSQ